MNQENQLLDLPLLPLRDVVIYPHMVIPLFVGREKSIQALETAMAASKPRPSAPLESTSWVA